MAIPELDENGRLPEGRHVVTLDEVETAFVLDTRFSASETRGPAFADLLSTLALLELFADDLVERFWLGGTFASGKENPSDIDVIFILKAAAYEPLSNSQKKKIARLCISGLAKNGLVVDAFFFAHDRIANPWAGRGVPDGTKNYLSIRGVWDDWWSRERRFGAKGQPALVEDSILIRGYLEVIVSGEDATLKDT
jgi:hypothetical protein